MRAGLADLVGVGGCCPPHGISSLQLKQTLLVPEAPEVRRYFALLTGAAYPLASIALDLPPLAYGQAL